MTSSRKFAEFTALGRTLRLAAIPLVLASLSACATGLVLKTLSDTVAVALPPWPSPML